MSRRSFFKSIFAGIFGISLAEFLPEDKHIWQENQQQEPPMSFTSNDAIWSVWTYNIDAAGKDTSLGKYWSYIQFKVEELDKKDKEARAHLADLVGRYKAMYTE